jgi:hypothetical protein
MESQAVQIITVGSRPTLYGTFIESKRFWSFNVIKMSVVTKMRTPPGQKAMNGMVTHPVHNCCSNSMSCRYSQCRLMMIPRIIFNKLIPPQYHGPAKSTSEPINPDQQASKGKAIARRQHSAVLQVLSPAQNNLAVELLQGNVRIFF